MITKIFFPITSKNRSRQWETIKTLPKNIVPITKLTRQELDYKVTERFREHSLPNRIKSIFQRIGIPNMRLITDPAAKDVDLIYSFGFIPLNKQKFMVEIDNVTCLSFYNPHVLRNPLLRKLIADSLKSEYCKRIICISNASRLSVSNTFKDKEIDKKIAVVYPYIKPRPKIKRNGDTVRFLYICTRFYEKGGREILEGFLELSRRYKNIELYMVTNIDDSTKNRYKQKNIFFIPAKLPKEELFKKYYTKCDVFVSLSYQDSFGLTTLEALSAGMPIIATDMFATTEMVKDGYNGFILPSPVRYFNKDFTPTMLLLKDMNVVARDMGLQTELMNGFVARATTLIEDPRLLKRMAKRSYSLVHNGPFSPRRRNTLLAKIFNESVRSVA